MSETVKRPGVGCQSVEIPGTRGQATHAISAQVLDMTDVCKVEVIIVETREDRFWNFQPKVFVMEKKQRNTSCTP
jgi:hypothetical protein